MQTDPQAAFIESAQALQARIATARVDPRPQQSSGSTICGDRRRRALNTCHRYAQTEQRPRKAVPRANRAYVPELAARIEDDPNLSDGARRCARKLAELTYRQNREGRSLPVTVTYLARALGRCRRTVQRYLRQLEREGYVSVDVVAGARTRMCVGLVVRLLEPLLAAHHRGKWPGALGKPGATRESQNKRFKIFSTLKGTPIPVEQWALRCMDGVFRVFMETKPLAGLPNIVLT
jgi:hypothetical protein